MKDFIKVYENVLPEGLCQHIISEFLKLKDSGIGWTRQKSENGTQKTKKDDYAIGLSAHQDIADFNDMNTLSAFGQGLQKCFDMYLDEFDNLKNDNLQSRIIKAQETKAGGGYHVWHHEQGTQEGGCNTRSLVWLFYLNTLPDEAYGETEFLYQQKRVKPAENTMVLWPASFTHPHRGNPVYGDAVKYVLTGWFNNE